MCCKVTGVHLGRGLFGGVLGTGAGTLSAEILKIKLVVGTVQGALLGSGAMIIGSLILSALSRPNRLTRAGVGAISVLSMSAINYGIEKAARMDIDLPHSGYLSMLTAGIGISSLLIMRGLYRAWQNSDCCNRTQVVHLTEYSQGGAHYRALQENEI